MTNQQILECVQPKKYNLWQRLAGKPEADRQRDKLERLKKKFMEYVDNGDSAADNLTRSEIQELLRLLP